jgi:hypothetical protein
MVYLYDACDQISDFCHQQLLRKMWRKISWKDGRTEVKQYIPLPFRERGYKYENIVSSSLIYGYKEQPCLCTYNAHYDFFNNKNHQFFLFMEKVFQQYVESLLNRTFDFIVIYLRPSMFFFSTNNTDRHDRIKILLIVVLSIHYPYNNPDSLFFIKINKTIMSMHAFNISFNCNHS